MPCICGEATCICYYKCICRPQFCFCQACITMRGPLQLTTTSSPSKQNHGQNESGSRKNSAAQCDPSNEEMLSLTDDFPPGENQMEQIPANIYDQRKETLGSNPATEASKPPSNVDPYPTIREQLSRPPRHSTYDPNPILRKRLSVPPTPPNDPYATLKRHLSQPAPPSNSDPHAILKRQLSQPAAASNYDPPSILKRRLSEPRRVPISGNLSSELPLFSLHKNPSSTGGSRSSSISTENLFLPPTNKTACSAAPSATELNKDFLPDSSTTSGSERITTPSDSDKSCASLEYLKKASENALPSYESFSSHFTSALSDENNNDENLGSAVSVRQYQGTTETSADFPNRSDEIKTALHSETSDASSAASSDSASQSLRSPNRLPSIPTDQEQPLNLSSSAEDKHKISFLHSLELSSRSPSPIPVKQQRMDTMEFSNIPTSEDNIQSAESYSGGSSGTFSNRQIILSTAEGLYPRTRSESTASVSGDSAYTSCVVQNPSQYTVRTEQYECPMETEVFSNDFDQNLISSLSAPTSGFFSPPPISPSSQISSTDVITYCNDIDDGRSFTLRTISSDLHNLQEIQNPQPIFADTFSETPEIFYSEPEIFPTSCEQTSTDRQSVIIYQSSQLPSQSLSTFSDCQTTNPINISSQAQVCHQLSSGAISPSMNLGDIGHFASQACNETQNPQASDFIQPTSDINMAAAFSVATSAEPNYSYDRSGEHLSHHSQSSTLQSTSPETPPTQGAVGYKDDETGENNYTIKSKRKLS